MKLPQAMAPDAPWLNQMQGLDVGSNGQLTQGAQDYYDAIFDQYASWGVDYVKVDDMLSTTYHSADVAGVAEAIAQSGRPMVLSLSPGPAPLSEASQLTQDANMWRMLNDMWDNWSDVSSAFAAAASWEQYEGINPNTGSGNWPDADMLPLGSFLNPPVGTALQRSDSGPAADGDDPLVDHPLAADYGGRSTQPGQRFVHDLTANEQRDTRGRSVEPGESPGFQCQQSSRLGSRGPEFRERLCGAL